MDSRKNKPALAILLGGLGLAGAAWFAVLGRAELALALAGGTALGVLAGWMLGSGGGDRGDRAATDSLFKSAIDQTTEGVMLVDIQTERIEEANQAALALLGHTEDSIRALHLRDILSGEETFVSAAVDVVRSGTHLKEYEIGLRRRNGQVLTAEISASMVEYGKRRLACIIFRDISERKKAEERASFFAYHDPLTQLPNRLLFQDRLWLALAQARRSKEMVGVMFVDVDAFKDINDTLGHSAGDRLICQVAERLTKAVRTCDTVARQGGDEFLVLLPRLLRAEEAYEVGGRILESLRQNYPIENRSFRVTASVGLTVFPGDGEDPSTLIRNADVAMYQAKAQGRNTMVVFDTSLSQRLAEFVELKQHIERALEEKEFEIHYQPQVSATTGLIDGLEALVRWRSPKFGMISPSRFIPVAEKTGLILPLGSWVLGEVFRQVRLWQEERLHIPRVAVNLSAKQVHREIVNEITGLIRKEAIHPEKIELEITESVAMHEPEATREILETLKKQGFSVALDDFGTGYSSLAYLQRFPFDRLKLDRAFIKNLATDKENQALVKGIISLAGSLGMEVVAEGVEMRNQLDLLCRMGCHVLQGYGLARPMPVREVGELLARQPNLLSGEAV